MLVIQFKNILKTMPDDGNVLVFTTKENGTRQLIRSDLDFVNGRDIVIDAEYETPVKKTLIQSETEHCSKCEGTGEIWDECGNLAAIACTYCNSEKQSGG